MKPDVGKKLKELAVLREQSKELSTKVSDLQKEIIHLLTEQDDCYDSPELRGVVVRSQTTSYDTEKIREILTDAMWVKVSDRVLSVDKLEDAVSKGKVSINDIVDAVVIKDRAPFIKITLKAGDA